MEKKIVSSFVGLVLFFVSVPAFSDDTNTFTGRIGIGFMVIDSGNNLNPNSSEKRIDNLDSAADRKTTALPMLLPAITWDVGEPDNVKLYFGTEPPLDEAGGFVLNFGGTYRYQDVGIIDASVFFTPMEETWENPYETGVKREKTSTSKYGLKIALNRIMGTGLRMNVVYMHDDVDDDLIGALMTDMEREGAVYALNVNYSFNLSETLELRPRLSIRKGDYEGDSNSFMKYKADLELRYMTGRLMVVPRIFYSHSDYDKVNPVFNETRENDSYGANVMASYMAPFGAEDWSLQALVGYSKGDSNIDFYDTEGLSLGMFASYHF